MSTYAFYIIFKYVYIEQCLEGLFVFVTRLTFTKFAHVILMHWYVILIMCKMT